MSELLQAGGILYDVESKGKHEVLRELVARLPLPPEQDRATLLSVLEAREELGSTGIGDGIAIPHVRNPIVLHVDAPFVTLALLRHPVEFEAVDGKPVDTLFMIVTPTVPVHLRILAQLGFLLRDPVLRDLMRQRAPRDQILERVEMLETTRSTGSYRASHAE
jgi:PTS system nitrogen regulatory IIA component